jgi:ABC-type multidrug transport system fused ATPase/permease subunit
MVSTLRRALRFLTSRERVVYVVLVLARMLTGILDVVGIVLVGFVASAVAFQAGSDSSGQPVRLLGIVVPRLDATGLFTLVALILGVFIVKAVLAVALTRVLTFFVARVETRAADRIAGYLLRGSLFTLKQRSTSEVQYAVTASSTFAFTGLLNNLATLVSESFLLVIISATFVFVNPLTALFTVLYFALFVVILQVIIARTLRRAGVQAVSGTIDTMSRIADATGAFREIRVMNKQEHFVTAIAESRRRISRSDAEMTFVGTLPRYVVETALILGVVILLGQQLLSGQLATGLATIGVFLTGGVRLMASLLPLQSALANIKQNTEQAQASLDLLDTARTDASPGTSSAPTPIVGEEIAPAVEVRNVSVTYPGTDGRRALDDVSLDVPAGHFVAIIGPSGAGKTTLVDVILGLITPQHGDVTVGGSSPDALSVAAPGLISYVPQKPGLVAGTIAQNVALGVDDLEIDRALVVEALTSAYLEDFIASLPDGIDTSVGKQVDSLSGGQIQRIGLARALYNRPRLLVLDEATSGLDASSEAFVAASLRRLHGHTTVIVVAHRLSTVQNADLVHVVEAGRVTASGTFAQVSEKNPTVAEYVRLMTFE